MADSENVSVREVGQLERRVDVHRNELDDHDKTLRDHSLALVALQGLPERVGRLEEGRDDIKLLRQEVHAMREAFVSFRNALIVSGLGVVTTAVGIILYTGAAA